MIDEAAVQLAFRARTLSVVVATTGSTVLGATTTGYSRPSGSFVAEGFCVGMEVVSAGFGAPENATPKIVTAVSALVLECVGCVAEGATGARSLTVGAPLLRAFENAEFLPVSGRPYLEEEFVPGAGSLLTFPANGAVAEDTGLYVLKWHGLNGTGIAALRKSVMALKALFAPGTAMVVGNSTVRVRAGSGNAPYSGQIIPMDGGWAVVVLTIPWRAYSTNQVVA